MSNNLQVFGTLCLLAASACAVEVGEADDPDSIVIDDDGETSDSETSDAERLLRDLSPDALAADVGGNAGEVGTIGYVPTEPSATQLLVNPGFESLLFTYTGWQLRGASTHVRQLTSAAYRGTYGLRTESEGSTTGWVVQCLPAVAGQAYQVNAWTQRIAGEGTGTQQIHLVFHGATYSPGSKVVPDSTSWNMVTLRRVAPAGTNKLCVAVGGAWPDGMSKRRWDDVRLYRD
jgi:hypothetical protein